MYGIEIIGYGKRKRYTIKKIVENGTIPVGYAKTYRMEEDARTAANAYGITIERVGDFWELMRT